MQDRKPKVRLVLLSLQTFLTPGTGHREDTHPFPRTTSPPSTHTERRRSTYTANKHKTRRADRGVARRRITWRVGAEESGDRESEYDERFGKWRDRRVGEDAE